MLELYKNAAATVPSASTDRVRLFVDTDGMFYAKDAAGTVTSVGGSAVDSVNGQTGAVVLAAADVGAEPADATILKNADIGVTVQGYSAVLAGTTASFTTTDETKLDGIAPGATAYSDASVDTHLNTGTATTDQVLSWNGTDYDWVDQSGGGGGALTISNKTAAYTIVAGDLGTIINCTSGTFTVSLTAADALGSGFNCWVWNTSTTATDATTIDPSGAETIDGRTTLILRRGEGVQIVCDGTNFQTGDKKAMRAYADNLSPTDARAIATGATSLAIGNSATASGGDSVAIGHYVTASGSRAMAFGSGVATTTASGTESLALGGRVTASASLGTAIGQNSSAGGSQAVGGSGAMALGGSYASGTNSFAAAVGNNTSTYGALGGNSVAIGPFAKASGTSSVALGDSVSATGTASFASGTSSTASGTASIAMGTSSSATAANAVAIGASARSIILGKFAFASGVFAAASDAQTGTFVLRRATTDATSTAVTTDGGTPGTTNQVILPNNSAYAFSGIIVARQQAAGGTASAAWKVEGLIRREGSAGTTVLVNSAMTVIDNAPGWTLALSADTTNGGLAVTATGAAATNIRWVATIQTSEVSYA